MSSSCNSIEETKKGGNTKPLARFPEVEIERSQKAIKFTSNQLVQISIHEFKYQCKSACWLVIKHFLERNNVFMWREAPKCLDFSQIIHLFIQIVK